MNKWSSRQRGVIARSFSAGETKFLRDKLSEVKAMVLTRLAECQENLIEWPFGESIDIRVTASQPEDPHLLRLMGAFLRASPRETWGLHECDLWEELVIGIAESLAQLPAEGRGVVELDVIGAEWLYGALIAVGIVHIEQARYGLAATEPDWADRTELLFAMVKDLEPFVRGAVPNRRQSLLKTQPE